MTDCEIKESIIRLEESIKRINDVMELKFQNNENAVLIASSEVNRRLEILNGESDRLKQMQATYLPREVYDQNHKALQDNVNQNRRALLVALISAFGSLVVMLLNFLLRK